MLSFRDRVVFHFLKLKLRRKYWTYRDFKYSRQVFGYSSKSILLKNTGEIKFDGVILCSPYGFCADFESDLYSLDDVAKRIKIISGETFDCIFSNQYLFEYTKLESVKKGLYVLYKNQ